MKRLWQVLGLVGVGGALLLSCNPPIEGELELLVEPGGVLSPCWRPDGKLIYYLVSFTQGEWGELWAINTETLDTQRITEEGLEISPFDISPDGSTICFSGTGWWHTRLYFMDVQNGTVMDSLAVDSIRYNSPPRYSRKNADNIYCLAVKNKSLSLHRLNRPDSTDEILISLPFSEDTPCFGLSCDDSWVVIGNTIYSLTGKDSIPLNRELIALDWHPTDPNLLVATAGDENLYFYDLSKDKWSRAKADTYQPSSNSKARFSPDGESVAFTSKADESEWADYALWLFKLSD